MKSKTHYVYIALCGDQSLYTGYTTDLDRRLEEHNNGKKGARYTKAHRPVELVYSEKFRSSGAAKAREAEIKKLSRERKLKLINK
jgi:putative endonuclease